MSRCSICGGSTWIIRFNPETKEDTAYPCECRLERDKRDSIRSKLVKAEIPPKYWEYTLDNYLTLPIGGSIVTNANTVSIRKLQSFINTPKDFLDDINVLWIWGRNPNAGHTSLAVIFAVELLKKGSKVRFIKMQDLISAFTDFDDKKDFFRQLDSFDVYLIDDAFDTSRCTAAGEYSRIHLYNWISSAISYDKHFICTSKVDIPQIDKQFEQSKNVLLKSRISLEFQGTVKKAGDGKTTNV